MKGTDEGWLAVSFSPCICSMKLAWASSQQGSHWISQLEIGFFLTSVSRDTGYSCEVSYDSSWELLDPDFFLILQAKEVTEVSPDSKSRELDSFQCKEQYVPTWREGSDGGCLWKLPTTFKIEKNFIAEKDLKDHLIKISHFIEEEKNNQKDEIIIHDIFIMYNTQNIELPLFPSYTKSPAVWQNCSHYVP